MFYAFSPSTYFIPIRLLDLISNDIIFPKIDKITTRYFHWSTFCKNDLHSSCNWSDYKAVLICANMNHLVHKRMISVFSISRLPGCPVPYKLPSCERFSSGQLLCSSYNWSYKVRFFKSCVLKAEFYFWPDTSCPLSPSPQLWPLSSRVPMLIRLMRYNLMFFVSICLLTAWCRESVRMTQFALLCLITSLCLGGLWSWDDSSVTDMARLQEMVITPEHRWKCYKGGR